MLALNDIPVARKFHYAFGLVCLLCVLLGVYSFFVFNSVSKQAEKVSSDDFPSVITLSQARSAMNAIRRADLLLLLCPEASCVTRYASERQKGIDDYKAAIAVYQPFIDPGKEREIYEKFNDAFNHYLEDSDRSLALLHDAKSGDALDDMMSPATVADMETAIAASDDDVKLNADHGMEAAEQVTASAKRALWINMSATFVIILLSGLVGFILNRVIAPRVERVTAALERVAQNDLTVKVDLDGADEIGRLGAALGTSVSSLCKLLGGVARDAETLAQGASEVSARAVQSAGNARMETGKINQIAAAAQQMTATISEISHNAASATDASRTSAETAQNGGAVMQAAAATMEKISSATDTVSEKMDSLALRSEEIGKVVNVIQEISEQTNLLALNAAIEAARAGEHGRGFAVVAGEVRRLAERTKSATEEIAGTIRSIQDETRETMQVMHESRIAVENGMKETANARSSLEETIEASRQVEQQINLIATAATQQATAAGEVSESAGHISQLAEQNAHGAEESVEMLKNLASLANDLDALIRQFRLDDCAQPGARIAGKAQGGVRQGLRTAHS